MDRKQAKMVDELFDGMPSGQLEELVNLGVIKKNIFEIYQQCIFEHFANGKTLQVCSKLFTNDDDNDWVDMEDFVKFDMKAEHYRIKPQLKLDPSKFIKNTKWWGKEFLFYNEAPNCCMKSKLLGFIPDMHGGLFITVDPNTGNVITYRNIKPVDGSVLPQEWFSEVE